LKTSWKQQRFVQKLGSPIVFFSVQVFEDMYLHIVIVANIDFIYNVINLMYNRESLVKSVLSAAN